MKILLFISLLSYPITINWNYVPSMVKTKIELTPEILFQKNFYKQYCYYPCQRNL